MSLDRPSESEPAGLPVGEPVDATPAKRPGGMPLVGRSVAVVPFDMDAHAADLYAATHGPERERLWFYLSVGPFAARADFDAYLERFLAGSDPVLYAIVDRASGRAVGHATYLRIEPAHRSVEVGHILFSPALARTAAATEAMALMMRHAFDDLGYRRFEWKCNALNAPSRRAAERLGFTFEGVFRRHLIHKGRSRDTAWYAVTDEEWPSRRAAFEAWLAPDNFRADGTQRRSLAELRRSFADQAAP
ncbi:GNAT family protein [Rhodoplanes sp. TEM]|uniref:GNAT family protein n=1 Tax=Rhodoplanes tepidamans TaxID=200616 RepID=A0ABT5JFJ0_RHOTP|nr:MULTISPECIES: GNAT family protein [Rhodoplanes]MDC7788339.1 GNAT family protein [Rhodoplanes tepidamans]MDC7986081.1 GNAT family protein [Rhodoplanes sp. TEM]MDQ0358820.1 RimJ/RimL family protein N-acetyltransferase [Rhodoplanes tepidamans]